MRRKKKLLLIPFLFLLFGCGGGPKKAFNNAVKAVVNRDVDAFQKYVDVRSFASSIGKGEMEVLRNIKFGEESDIEIMVAEKYYRGVNKAKKTGRKAIVYANFYISDYESWLKDVPFVMYKYKDGWKIVYVKNPRQILLKTEQIAVRYFERTIKIVQLKVTSLPDPTISAYVCINTKRKLNGFFVGINDKNKHSVYDVSDLYDEVLYFPLYPYSKSGCNKYSWRPIDYQDLISVLEYKKNYLKDKSKKQAGLDSLFETTDVVIKYTPLSNFFSSPSFYKLSVVGIKTANGRVTKTPMSRLRGHIFKFEIIKVNKKK